MIKSKRWFKLFSSCFLVKGESASVIVDTERFDFYDISNEYIGVIEEIQEMSLDQLEIEYGEQFHIIKSIINQFIKEEIGFITAEPEAYPSINLEWKSPYSITNAIIEITELDNYDVKRVVSDLNILGCQSVEIRFIGFFKLKHLEDVLKLFCNTRIKNIEVIIPDITEFVSIGAYKNLIRKYNRISFIKVYGSKSDKIIKDESPELNNRIIFCKKDISKNNSEIISKGRFTKNLDFFTEAQHYNVGLNKKVSISSKGDIKNYLNHKKVFGNVRYDDVKLIVSQKSFQEKWEVSNDQIEKCRRCQYRYSCMSNSDIILRKDKFYKIDTCSFDPLNNTWL